MSKVKKKIRNKLLNHSIEDLIIDDNYLKVRFAFQSNLAKKYIVFKDRKSGRRFQAVVDDKVINISLDQLSDVNREGVFDVFLKTYIFGQEIKKRTKFNSNIKLVNYIDRKNKNLLRVYKTAKNNLSISSEILTYNQNIKDIRLSKDGFWIFGEVEDFENQHSINIETLLIRRDTNSLYQFSANVRKRTSGERYEFESEVDFTQINEIDKVKNARWDVYLQLKDSLNNVLYRQLINLQSYKDFKHEEDRYLLQYEHDDENLTAVYATMGRNSLALWYTDKAQFNTTYNIAKGKTIFNQVARDVRLNEKMVFFESFLGKNYSGNPKYIYEEMLKSPKFNDFTFIWSYTGDHPEEIPGKPVLVDRESGEYYRYMAESRYWVSNILFPVHKKREGNVYIQTWHGTPLKRLGFDIEIEGPETLARENFYIESRNWDYLIAANHYSGEIFKRAFKFEKEMLEIGYPANDILYRSNQGVFVEKLKEKLNIPLGKKVILYAPTWRDNEMVGSWKHAFNLKFDLDKLYEKFNDEYVLVLRMHHLISESLVIDEKYNSFVFDMSHFDDIQELYVMSDILITDYSSVFFDFANTKRPMLFYAYDYEEYKNNIRGFYLDMEHDLPGPLLREENELFHAIENIEAVHKEYGVKYEEFYHKFCGLEDGNAAKRLINKVFNEN